MRETRPEVFEMLYGRMNGVPERLFGEALVTELGDRVVLEMYYEAKAGSIIFYMPGAELCPDV